MVTMGHNSLEKLPLLEIFLVRKTTFESGKAFPHFSNLDTNAINECLRSKHPAPLWDLTSHQNIRNTQNILQTTIVERRTPPTFNL